MTAEDFNKPRKETLKLNYAIDKLVSTDTYKIFHLTNREHALLPEVHGTYS